MAITIKELSEKFDVHYSTVSAVLRRNKVFPVIKSRAGGQGKLPAQYEKTKSKQVISDYASDQERVQQSKRIKKALEKKKARAKRKSKKNWTGLSKGDKITITNRAGRSWTGIFIKSDAVFGYMRIANRQTFNFANDAQIRKASKNTRLSLSNGELLQQTARNREFGRKYSETLKARCSMIEKGVKSV